MTRTSLSSKTDNEILSMHRAGDTDAFGELYRRYHDRMCAVAAPIAGDQAEDAVQDAMVSAYRNAAQFRGESAVATWLHRIVVNAALDIVRRPSPVGLPQDVGYPPWRIEQATTRHMIRRHLRRLPAAQRSCLVLVDMLGYPVAEAASILGISEGTLKSRCARGRAKLADRLSAYGVAA